MRPQSGYPQWEELRVPFKGLPVRGKGREVVASSVGHSSESGVEEFCLSDAVKGQEPKESTVLVQRRKKRVTTRRSIQSGGIVVRIKALHAVVSFLPNIDWRQNSILWTTCRCKQTPKNQDAQSEFL